jgi:hypothetical protein
MAEPTLNLAYKNLMGEVGFFLGYGRGALLGDVAWNAQQQLAIDSVVASGLRQFYYPPVAPGMTAPMNWSFLKPLMSLDLPAGAQTAQLPFDFGGVEGEMTILAPQNTTWFTIKICDEGQIRQEYSRFPNMTGRPLRAGVEQGKRPISDRSQTQLIFFFPTADTDYTIQCQYYVNPDYLSGALPYAYGGPQHAETLLESCLAIAEQRLDDRAEVHSQKWMERLTASIGQDIRNKAQNLGYNQDRSDAGSLVARQPWWHYGDSILFNGVQY